MPFTIDSIEFEAHSWWVAVAEGRGWRVEIAGGYLHVKGGALSVAGADEARVLHH